MSLFPLPPKSATAGPNPPIRRTPRDFDFKGEVIFVGDLELKVSSLLGGRTLTLNHDEIKNVAEKARGLYHVELNGTMDLEKLVKILEVIKGKNN